MMMDVGGAALRRGRRPVPGSAVFDKSNPVIYMGTVKGARKARARPGSLLVPMDIDPELLAWPVQDLDVLLVADSGERKSATPVAAILLRNGARMVAIVGGQEPASIHRELVA